MMTDNHEKYGPRTAVVEKVIDRAGRLTDKEIRALVDARVATVEDTVWHFFWNATHSPTYIAAKSADRYAAWDAAWADAWDAARGYAVDMVVSDVAADAACVATVADLVGQHGLERWHLEMLAKPWCQVIIDVDPLEGIGDD